MAELEDITTTAIETLHPADLADQLQRVETEAALETAVSAAYPQRKMQRRPFW